MIDRDECTAALRGFIERADRGEIADAQGAIIQFALAQPDAASRARAMDALRAALVAIAGDLRDPMQQAYLAVIDAMVERTREAVLDGTFEAGTGGRPAQ